jgi:hypothetical protein
MKYLLTILQDKNPIQSGKVFVKIVLQDKKPVQLVKRFVKIVLQYKKLATP